MLKLKLLAATAGVTLLGFAAPASAGGFINGSFEDNSCGAAPGTFATIAPGNSCINGWSAGPDTVDLVREGYWDAHDGQYSVDLAGNAPGSISQTFDTVVNALYTVNYWLSANPEGGIEHFKDGLVKAVINNSNVYLATFTGYSDSTVDMKYRPQSFQFTATGTSTTLTFASASDEGAFGPVIDAVQVIAPVPEPATWATMLFGFGLIGFGMRKRKATQRQARLRVAYA
jgi:choice-of-anchor C domain-containing protein